MICRLAVVMMFSLIPFVVAQAHVDGLPSIHDTIAGIKQRLLEEVEPGVLVSLRPEQVVDLLTEEEREILSTTHMHFQVNVPVDVYVFAEERYANEPFWLAGMGFEATEFTVVIDDTTFAGWKKPFDAGTVGLGVISFSGGPDAYIVGVQPQEEGADLEVTSIYPGQIRMSVLNEQQKAYVDDSETIVYVPEELKGMPFLRTQNDRDREARLVGIFRETRFPATTTPDQIVLTWSDDPQTTQTIQWRTSAEVSRGMVVYARKSDIFRPMPRSPREVEATTVPLETPHIVNDPVTHRHTATLQFLEPETTYVYSVGDGSDDGWTEWAEFTTAPEGIVPFSFVYLGDAQNGLDRWGSLAKQAHRHRPDANFWIMAGDLVNVGNERWDWDDFFHNADPIFQTKQLVPAIGNHENQGGHPTMYLDMFTLMTNGPEDVEPERAYTFTYSNALFVVLDSNMNPGQQAQWLKQTLAASDHTWKFVIHHHPAYSSAPRRDNPSIREYWVPLYDEYKVDMVMQGHDHAYLRSYPLRGGEIQESPGDGTVYVVSVSGVKMYDQAQRYYTEFGMTNTSTYQVLDIQIVGDRMLYRAYDADGNLRDSFEINK